MAALKTLTCIATIVLPLFGGSPHASERHGREGSPPLLTQADTLQYEHKFDEALALLERVLERDEQMQQARLMQARILLAQGRIQAAKESCLALMGKASLTISGTCLLEVRGRETFVARDLDALQQTYLQLQQLHRSQAHSGMPENPSAVFVWQRQLLAEQAFLLGHFSESTQWLNYATYAQHPTVNQLRLLDSWQAMEQPRKILATQEGCPRVGYLPEDSIIVRLAAAEQDLATGQRCWQKLAAERIAIRVARADPLHTSDLAYYFIFVQPDVGKAQLYAEQNYAVAREPADQRLLAAAQQLTEVSHEH